MNRKPAKLIERELKAERWVAARKLILAELKRTPARYGV
jgi:hypothetical protein